MPSANIIQDLCDDAPGVVQWLPDHWQQLSQHPSLHRKIAILCCPVRSGPPWGKTRERERKARFTGKFKFVDS